MTFEEMKKIVVDTLSCGFGMRAAFALRIISGIII